MVASVQTASAAQQNLKSLIEKEHLMNALQVSAEKPMTLKALPERIPQANITPVIKKTPGTTPAAVAAHATDLDPVEVTFRSLYNDPF